MKLEIMILLYGFYPITVNKKHDFWKAIDKYISSKNGDWQKAYHILCYEWRHDKSIVNGLYDYLMKNYPYNIPQSLFFTHLPYWHCKYIRNNKKKYYQIRKISGLAIEEFTIEDLANKWLRDCLSGESFFDRNKNYFKKSEVKIFFNNCSKFTDDNSYCRLIKQYISSKIFPVNNESLIYFLFDKFKYCFNHPFVDNFYLFIRDNYKSAPTVNIIQDICDYIKNIVDKDNQQYFSFKGRTWGSLRRLSDEWHGITRMPSEYIEDYKKCKLKRFSFIKDFVRNINNKRWEIKQLTTGISLYNEGEYMHHCCFSYVTRCIDGQCAIFSLRCYDKTTVIKEKSATIEISDDRKLIQSRGRFNTIIDKETRTIIDQWKSENGIINIEDCLGQIRQIQLERNNLNENNNYNDEWDNYYEYLNKDNNDDWEDENDYYCYSDEDDNYEWEKEHGTVDYDNLVYSDYSDNDEEIDSSY